MNTERSRIGLLTAVCLATLSATAVLAGHGDDYDGHSRHGYHGPYHRGEFKETYREGPCKVEREMKRDGSYKKNIECKGPRGARYHRGAESEEKYQDGPCKIEREWKGDGTYKEKVECEG